MKALHPHPGAGIAAFAFAAMVWSGSVRAAKEPEPEPPAEQPTPDPSEPPSPHPPEQPAAPPPAQATPPAVPTALPASRPSIIKIDPAKAPTPAEPPPASPQPGEATAENRGVPPSEASSDEPVETELTLKDKRRIVGVLIRQTEEAVTLSVGGVPTVFDMFSVESVRTLPPVDEQYQALRASIDPNDADGLTRLAEWLRVHRRLNAALLEVERALRAEPTNPEARQLKIWIEEQQKLEASRVSRPPAARRPQPSKEVRPEATPFPLLSDEQINLIRVYEVDLARPPRLIIPRAVIDEFVDKYAGTRVEGLREVPSVPEQRAVFTRQPAVKILEYIFALRAREFYDKVTVQDNPRAMQMFVDNVNRSWLTGSCATSRCHGGEEAGRLWLYDKRPMSNAAAYTNFFILENFRTSSGSALIDYEQPAESPLLQLGLPREQSKYKHPDVGGPASPRWKPAFRSVEDEKFVKSVEWIRAMFKKRTAYPIDYTPPVPRGASNSTADDREPPPR